MVSKNSWQVTGVYRMRRWIDGETINGNGVKDHV